jgi:glutaredoxin-related protein
MNYTDIHLESMSRSFEFEKLSRDIGTIDNIEELKNLSRFLNLRGSLHQL